MNHTADRTIPPGEDIDALLGAYFRREMPSPWPAFQPPARVLPFRPATRRRRWLGSRPALAACVALLMLCGWLLSGSLRAPSRGPDLPPVGGADADVRKGGHRLMPELPPGPAKQPEKVKSSLNLEQGVDGRTGIRITVEELPPNK